MFRARESLQNLRALLIIGFQKRREIVLSQQHGSGELFECQADFFDDRVLNKSPLAAFHEMSIAARRDVTAIQSHLDILQLAARLVVTSTDAPASGVLLLINADEGHFREAKRRISTQQHPSVVLFFTIGEFRKSPDLIEPWRLIEQRQAQRVEQRGLASSGGSADRIQTSGSERCLREIHRMSARQRCDVASGDAFDFHPSRVSANRISRNAATTRVSGSMP